MEKPKRGERLFDALYTGFFRASPDVRRTTYRERARRSEMFGSGSFVALWRRPTGRSVIKFQIRPGTATVTDGELRFMDHSRDWQWHCVPNAVTTTGTGRPWYGRTTRLRIASDDAYVDIDVPENQTDEIIDLVNSVVVPHKLAALDDRGDDPQRQSG